MSLGGCQSSTFPLQKLLALCHLVSQRGTICAKTDYRQHHFLDVHPLCLFFDRLSLAVRMHPEIDQFAFQYSTVETFLRHSNRDTPHFDVYSFLLQAQIGG